MGLNFETLVWILALLIIAILVDGFRRMMMERRSQSNLQNLVGGEEDEYDNPELPGEVRVVKRTASATAPAAVPSADALHSEEGGQIEVSTAPPVEEEAIAEAPAVEPKAAPQPRASRPVTQEPSEVITVHLVAPKGYTFGGEGMLQLFTAHGLEFGEMNIFHAYGEEKEAGNVQFSMANAVTGTFDYATIDSADFAGFTFFLALPGPKQPLLAIDRMLEVVTSMAQRLGAEMKDEHRSVLTQQTMDHLRERVREFERRSHLVRS